MPCQPLTLLGYGFLFSSFNGCDLARVGIAALVNQASFGESNSAASGGRNGLLHDSSFFEYVLIIRSNSDFVNHFVFKLLRLPVEPVAVVRPALFGQLCDHFF